MFNVSGLEILVIVIVALLVFGPEQLPALAKSIGSWLKQAKQVMGHVKDEVNKAAQEASTAKPPSEQDHEQRKP